MREIIIDRISYYINRTYKNIWKYKINKVINEYYMRLEIDTNNQSIMIENHGYGVTCFNYRDLGNLERFDVIYTLKDASFFNRAVGNIVNNY